MKAYTEAIREKFRFYSFGDAMLIVFMIAKGGEGFRLIWELFGGSCGNVKDGRVNFTGNASWGCFYFIS